MDKLEAKGWIARSTALDDGRVQLLSLTRQGTRSLPELAAIAAENDRVCFAGLDFEEQAILRRLLGKLVGFHQIQDVPIE
jgi:DNA-binding MarR family transcriptional regulator